MISVKLFFQSKKYFASAFLYFCFSLIFSTWVTYIPHIAEKLEITEGSIGKALFFTALGAFFMIRICRHIIERVGVGRYAYYALIIYCICFLGPFLAKTYISLCISLFFFGAAGSSYAISLNSLIATIEKQDQIYIMSGSHGFWSIGGMIGSATGGFFAAILHNPVLHSLFLVILIQIIHISLRKQYYLRKGEQVPRMTHGNRKFFPLIVIAVIGLIVMVSEGAIADWSAMYLKKIVLLDVKYIGFGYSAFSLAMMTGRFSGDSLSKKFGSWQVITYSSFIAIIGFIMILMINPLFSLSGFFIVGLGFSVIVPEVYRLVSNIEGIKTSVGVSFVAATTNIGFLLGPVLLGLIAELKSLHLSFTVLTGWVSIAFFIALCKFRRKIHQQ